jgi:heat shock protein HslJ
VRKAGIALILMAGAAQAQDGDWRVFEIAGHPVAAEVTLDIAGDRVSGRAACNRYFGSYTDGRFGRMGSTRMACDPALMQVEAQFLDLLAQVDGIDLDKGELRLLRGTQIVARAR